MKVKDKRENPICDCGHQFSHHKASAPHECMKCSCEFFMVKKWLKEV